MLLLAGLAAGPALAARGGGRGPNPNGPGTGTGSGTGRSPGGQLVPGLLTPSERLREFGSTRTQVTESPTTSARRGWSAELGIVSYSRDVLDSLRAEDLEYAPLSVGYAFSDRFELIASADPYGTDHLRNMRLGTSTTASGTGGWGLRARRCWVGSDSSAWAVGTTVFASRPTAADTAAPRIEMGIKVPASVALPAEITLGLMAEVDRRNNPGGDGQHTEWLESASLSRDLRTHLSGFVEAIRVSSAQLRQPWLGALDAGLEWTAITHVNVGIGGSFGISHVHRQSGLFTALTLAR
jgi:hypothetical protein